MLRKVLLLVVLMASFATTTLAQEKGGNKISRKIQVYSFDKLRVDGDLLVMLVEEDTARTVYIEGKRDFVNSIHVKMENGGLTIQTTRKVDYARNAIVYVPVRTLRNLEVNADAKVYSLNELSSTTLDVLINGNCTVSIDVAGIVNFNAGPGYSYKYAKGQPEETVSRQ